MVAMVIINSPLVMKIIGMMMVMITERTPISYTLGKNTLNQCKNSGRMIQFLRLDQFLRFTREESY